MITIDSTSVLVFNTNDLRDAVSSNNGITHVYFGADITLEYGITIYPGKASLIFDGTYNDNITRTFTDMNSLDLNNTIGIRSVSSIKITFQNINLIGRNFYGIPYIPNSATYVNVSTLYKNVSYNGIQICHNPYGFASFIDCDITVSTQELAEIRQIEIGGETKITKTGSGSSLLNFYGNSANKAYFKILKDANVTISTVYYFMYEASPPDYIIESGASLSLTANSGISLTAAHTINSFFVGENASFTYFQSSNRGYATMYLSGALTVEENAKFYMQADFSNNHPLIYFISGSPGLYLNEPKSFVLYNKGNTSAKAFYFAVQTPFVFTVNQINRWSAAKDFPAAGTFEDIPDYKWKREDYSLFKIEGNASLSQTVVNSHDFTADDLAQMSSLNELKLYDAFVFSAGNLPLLLNRIIIGKKPITGKTEKGAKVRVLCIGVGPYPDCNADDRGVFFSEQAEPVTTIETFNITANTPFLLTALTAESQGEGGLSIIEAPAGIAFTLRPLGGFSETILPRQVTDEPVIVLDERSERTQWVVWVRIAGPLKTAENDVLDNAVVFANEDGNLITLTNKFTAIYTDGPYIDVDNTEIRWDNNRGLLARISVPIRSKRRYTTNLDWVVYPAGIEPE